MKRATWRKREAGLVLAILVPCFLLGFYGLILTGRQKNSLVLEIREALLHELKQVSAAIQKNIEDEEKRIIAELASPQINSGDGLILQKEISEIMARHPLVSYPFVLNSQGEYLFPPAMQGTSPRASATPKPGSEIATPPAFSRAESLEYERKEVTGALKLYAGLLAGSPSPGLKVHLLEALGRCYFKLDMYAQAASYYRSLESESHVHPSAAHFRFLSLRQQALCHKLDQNREAAYTAYLRLYESLLLTPEKSSEIDFFRLEAIDYLQTAIDFSTEALSQYPRELYPLKSSTLNQQRLLDVDLWPDPGETESPSAGSKRRRFEKIREIYNPNDEETLFYPFLKKYLTPARVRESPGSLFHLFPTFSGRRLVAACALIGGSEKVIIGFCLDGQYIIGSLLPKYIPARLTLPRFQAVLCHAAGNPIFPPKTTLLHAEPGVETALDYFPDWKLSAFSENNHAVEGAAREKLRSNYAMMAGLIVSLFFGLIIYSRSLSRERRLVREKAAFIQAAAHNLRTPLAKIHLLAEKLQLGWLQDAGKTEGYLQQIIFETSDMSRAIGRMLDFSRLEAKKRQLHFEPIDPVSLITEVLEAFTTSFSHQSVQVETDMEPQLPFLLGDREALASALSNLVDNALKHSEKEKQLKISAYAAGDLLILEVADRGPGIAPEEREKVFEPFQRGSRPPSALPPGYGLGLFLVQEIITAHGGRIGISDRPGGGTIFRIELPTIVNSKK